MINARTAQERSGMCNRCERQVLIRRQRTFWGWGDWRCTVCGMRARPIHEPMGAGKATAWKIIFFLAGSMLLIFALAGLVASLSGH